MATSNIIIARHEYAQEIANVTNKSPLPACIKLDVLRQVVEQLTRLADAELKQALAAEEEKQ